MSVFSDNSAQAINFTGELYQNITADRLIQFDGTSVVGVYDYISDPMLRVNILDNDRDEKTIDATRHLKSVLQQYSDRVLNNKLVPDGIQ